MHRHELTDEQWAAVEPLLPKRTATTGRPPSDPRLMLSGILWVLCTGAPWRDLPPRFGPWQTVYDHFRNWRRSGVYAAVTEALQLRLDKEGRIDWDLWCVDGASVRAARAAAGACKKVASGAAASGTRASPRTMRWAAAGAGSGRSSTWSLTVTELRWPSR